MFCQKCGKEIPNNTFICPYCNSSTGKYNDTPQPIYDNTYKKKIYERWWFWILIVLFVLVILFTLVNHGSSLNTKSINNDLSTIEKDDNFQTNNVGDYNVILKKAQVVNKNNKNYIIVTYTFTNNSDENKSFANTIECTAFQDGIELGSVLSSYGIDEYDMHLKRKEIQPSKALDVQEIYELNDNHTPIEIQVRLLFDFSEKLYDTFNIELQ